MESMFLTVTYIWDSYTDTEFPLYGVNLWTSSQYNSGVGSIKFSVM